MLADLFQTSPQNLTLHLKTLYSEGEIAPEATCKSYLQVRSEGERQVRGTVKFYNFDAILAVGYRVRLAAAHSSADGPRNVCASIWSRASP